MLASIATATQLNKVAIPSAANPALSDPCCNSALREPVSHMKPIPTIIPNIVPAKPKYNGIGVWVLMSSSTESQFLSTVSFNNWKSITLALLLARYLLNELFT